MSLVLLVRFTARPALGAAPQNTNSAYELYFAAGTIDTRQTPQATQLSAAEQGEALHLVQFSGPIQDAWLTAVAETGARPLQYIANYGYLLWADASAREQLDQLVQSSDFLRFSAPYQAPLKISPTLAAAQEDGLPEQEMTVAIQIVQHDGSELTKKRIAELISEPLTAWEPVLGYQNLLAELPLSAVAGIAALPDVVWIEPYLAPQRMDEKQAQILAGLLNEEATAPTGPGYRQWLLDLGFSEDPLDYPIIDITDDGIGNGSAIAAAGDRTFRQFGELARDSRIAYLSNCTNAADASGPDGHGHLNASIAAGFDLRPGLPYQDEAGYQRGLGLNPFGRLAGTRIFNGPNFELANCGNTYQGLLQQSYAKGARIVSNSWGCTSYTCPSSYNLAAQAYDVGVRDADPDSPGNQEVLVLFSAGNVGNAARIGSPANAKNVIAVGATENVRPGWTDACGFGPEDADNVQDIARYSSRGPAPGGRVKPDLVAPGTHIVGTASTAVDYSGSAICDPYHPQSQLLFAASTGTSHSVPAVAGSASLATFWLREQYGLSAPSPALLKAFLMANTRYLQGVSASDDLPSFSQGFGLLDLARAFDDRALFLLDQGEAAVFNETGENWTVELEAVDSSRPVRVVMAYTDAPGAAPTADPRVNDLDLTVTAGTTSYAGNDMIGPWSQPDGEPDPLNNVEAVFLPAGRLDSFEVTVSATQIAGDGVPGLGSETDQDFALVCENCRMQRPFDFKAYYPIFPSQ